MLDLLRILLNRTSGRIAGNSNNNMAVEEANLHKLINDVIQALLNYVVGYPLALWTSSSFNSLNNKTNRISFKFMYKSKGH